MIRIELPSGTIGLTFQHFGDAVMDERLKKMVTHPNRTVAQILDYNDAAKPVTIALGRSVCHKLDNFSRETGRKLALAKALNVSGLSKKERQLIWLTYLNRNTKIPDPVTSVPMPLAAAS
jgi:hypothetical protein